MYTHAQGYTAIHKRKLEDKLEDKITNLNYIHIIKKPLRFGFCSYACAFTRTQSFPFVCVTFRGHWRPDGTFHWSQHSHNIRDTRLHLWGTIYHCCYTLVHPLLKVQCIESFVNNEKNGNWVKGQKIPYNMLLLRCCESHRQSCNRNSQSVLCMVRNGWKACLVCSEISWKEVWIQGSFQELAANQRGGGGINKPNSTQGMRVNIIF